MKTVFAFVCWFLFSAGQVYAGVAASTSTDGASGVSDTASAGSYTVVKGDTLWGISGRLYQNSSQWPKLWEANKQSIADPDIIHVNQVLIVPDISAPVSPAPEVSHQLAPPASAATEDEESTPEMVGNKVVPAPEPATVEKSHASVPSFYKGDGFIAPKNWEGDGIIVSDKDKKLMISDGDTVFVNLGSGQVSPGTTCTIYRRLKKVKNPDDGNNLGIEVRLIGMLEITSSVEKDSSTAKITNVREPVEVGDIVCIKN